MLLISAVVLFCCANSALSGITTGSQRINKLVEETAKFQWSVTGSISNVSVHNQTLGYPGPLNANADYMMDNRSGVVILIINKVQLYDAGNYSLSVTVGTTTQTDSTALLFVYGRPSIFINQTSGGSGQQPATEGDAVELTCTAISTSLPVAYRPRMYYKWTLPWVGFLQNISSGQPTLSDYGDPVPGYRIKNDGRTLVIASVQYRDTQGIYCYGQEQWSWFPYGSSVDLPLKYRPFVSEQSPASRKFNAIVGDIVSYLFDVQAFPNVISASDWSFTNTSGHAHDLPNSYYPWSRNSIKFKLTSEAYYGNYSITLNNSVGATTETFQVLGLGPPDVPSRVIVDFVSHYIIGIAWNCMWSNGRPQTIFLQLRSMRNNSIIDYQNTTVFSTRFNSTYTTQFRNGIQPESDYEVRVWSTNNLGSSDVVELSVRTPKAFKFFVSPKTISFNGNQAIVNFSASDDRIKRLVVGCCVEFTTLCDRSGSYDVNGTSGQLKFDITQSGDVYMFDFRVYGVDPGKYLYYLIDVRVPRNGETDEPDDEKPDDKKPDDKKPDDEKRDDKKPDDNKPDDEKPSPLPVAIIVLGVLLGVAVLALIGCLLAIIVLKRRQNMQPKNSQQPQFTAVTTRPGINRPVINRPVFNRPVINRPLIKFNRPVINRPVINRPRTRKLSPVRICVENDAAEFN